jgi:transposase
MSEKRKYLSTKDFLTIAHGCQSNEEIAEKTGLKLSTVKARLLKYYKEGVNAPRFVARRGAPKMDVAEINAFLAELDKQQAQES